MKKGIAILLSTIIIVTLLFSNAVFAVEDAKFGIGLTASKTSVNPGDEITVTLKVKDFQNVQEGIYSFLAKIEYDSQVFETLTESSVKGLGSWSSEPTFNPENGKITADAGTAIKSESDVFTITLKVKSGVQRGASTTITVKDFEASEGDYDIQANAPATVTINVIEALRLSSTKYTINEQAKLIMGIKPGETKQTIKSNLTSNLGYNVLTKDGQIVQNEKIGTGMKMQFPTEEIYEIVVTGDTNGDGKISTTDITKIKKHIIKKEILQGIYAKAGDINGDEKISVTDLAKMKKVLVGLATI